MYKEGMQINLNKEVSQSTYCYVAFSVLIMIAFYAAIPLAIFLKEEKLFYIMLVGLIYMIMSCCTDTCKYINNLVELPQVFQNIAQAIRNAPTKTFHIECYHWETRTHREKDSNGNYHTRTERIKVHTHRAT